MKNLIRFKKQRELGTIITDTFTFLRDNWKPLFGLIFKIAGPALLFLVLAYVYYMQPFSAILSMMDNLDAAEVMPTSLLLYMFLLVLAGVVYYALLNGVVLHYIQSYINNNGAVKTTEVTDGIRNDFWKLIGTGIVIGILTTVGMILCVIPGIYIGVALSPLYAI